MMHKTDANLFEMVAESQVEVLTSEGKILRFLMENGASRVKEVMLCTGVSYGGFYLAVDKLKHAQLITTTTDQRDRRVRLMHLAV
jgi:DNA-binding MarR family transcriptional regulator